MEACKGTRQEAGEKERNKTGGDKKEKETESTKGVGTSRQVGASGNGIKVKKDKVDQKKDAKSQTSSDVVKGRKTRDEL